MGYKGMRKHNKGKKIFAGVLCLAVVLAGGYTLYKNDVITVDTVDAAQETTQVAENKQDTQEQEVVIPPQELIPTIQYHMAQPEVNYKQYYDPRPLKGVYISGYVANSEQRLQKIIDLADETEINSVVIDVKDDNGRITFKVDNPVINEINADISIIDDIDSVIKKLKEHNITPIARIVCFKDPYLATHKTDYAIKNPDGSLWKYNKIAWLNPYQEGTWHYITEVAEEAILAGFEEIQFDYIRFESTRHLKQSYLGPAATEKTRTEVISSFLDYANAELGSYGVPIGADVFGTIITSQIDADLLGQDYLEMAKRLDYICPMIYPSHYSFGYFGIPRNKHADLYPYEIIKGALEASNKRYEELPGEELAVVRPWLQAFDAPWIGEGNWQHYGGKQIREQIQGTYDAGQEEWILWHAGGKYSSDGLEKESEDQ